MTVLGLQNCQVVGQRTAEKDGYVALQLGAGTVKTKNITIKGEMHGNMTAEDKVEIHQGARVIGNITAPRVVIAEGARFKGHIDMSG